MASSFFHGIKRVCIWGACALWLIVAPPARAQEPTYVYTQRGGSTMAVSLRVTARPEGTTIRLFDATAPDTTPTHSLATTLELDADGIPRYCLTRFTPQEKSYSSQVLEATPSAQERTSYQVVQPKIEGVLRYSGMLLTNTGLQLGIGKIYDSRKGGPQQFPYLLEYGVRTPSLCTLTLAADGKEEISVGGEMVTARRLKYRAASLLLPKDRQSGVLYVGPAGELLRCDTGLLFGKPYQTASPAKVDARTGLITVPVEKPVAFTISGRPVTGRVEISLVTTAGFSVSTTLLDRRFSMLQMTSHFRGRKATFQANGTELHYFVEPGAPSITAAPSGRPFYFAHWFATELWEENERYFAGMEPGDKRDSDYIPLYFGFPGAYPFTVERLGGRSVIHAGQKAAVRCYRFIIWSDSTRTKAANHYDIYTDGRRLIAALGVGDAVTIRRVGWEDFTGSLKPTALPSSASAERP
jgi:hypothetical protein